MDGTLARRNTPGREPTAAAWVTPKRSTGEHLCLHLLGRKTGSAGYGLSFPVKKKLSCRCESVHRPRHKSHLRLSPSLCSCSRMQTTWSMTHSWVVALRSSQAIEREDE